MVFINDKMMNRTYSKILFIIAVFLISSLNASEVIKIKNVYESKSDFHEKLSTRAHLFNDLLYFKGCPYINHGFFSKIGP